MGGGGGRKGEGERWSCAGSVSAWSLSQDYAALGPACVSIQCPPPLLLTPPTPPHLLVSSLYTLLLCDQRFSKLRCYLCKKPEGACIQCEDCYKAYHAMCAQKHNCYVTWKKAEDGVLVGGLVNFFCVDGTLMPGLGQLRTTIV